MSKYSDIIPILVKELGGVDNVSAVTHCVSRLRLVLNDYDKVDVSKLENIKFVKGVFKVNGQIHIIFGQEVNDVYDEFVSYNGMAGKQMTASQVKTLGAKKESFTKRMMNHLGEIFIPLIPILVAGGLILALRNIFETKWDGTWSIIEIPFFKGLNDFLWIPACAVFWFLPVFIVWSIFKKMNGSQPMGILIGLSLLVAMPSTYELNGSINSGVGWNLITDFFTKTPPNFHFDGWGNYPIKVGYTSQVVPAIAIAFIGVYIERFLNKTVTPVLRQVVVPLVTVLASYSLAMLVVGPVGFVIGTTISIIFSMALTNPVGKYFAAPIFGFIYAPLVITGLHHTLNAVMAQNAGTLGGTLIFPILAISNICQGASALMYGWLHRQDNKIKDVAYPACVSAWLGVTEPAMYGVNIKNRFPFFAACVGSAIGSTLVTAAGVTASGIGNGAWLGVLNMQATSQVQNVYTWPGTGFAWFMIAAILATIGTMMLTLVFSKFDVFSKIANSSFYQKTISIIPRKNKTKNESLQVSVVKTENNFVYSSCNGTMYSLDVIKDDVIKKRVLGDGVAIECLDGKVYSPIDGKITVIADTKHAYAINSDDGLSILIHIGIDTVKLEGKYFSPKVELNQNVKKGDLICEFDSKNIKKEGYENRVLLLVTTDSTKPIKEIKKIKKVTTNDVVIDL